MEILVFIIALTGFAEGEAKDFGHQTVEECYEFITSDEFQKQPDYAYICGKGIKLVPGQDT